MTLANNPSHTNGVGSYNCKEHNDIFHQFRKDGIVMWAHRIESRSGMSLADWCISKEHPPRKLDEGDHAT